MNRQDKEKNLDKYERLSDLVEQMNNVFEEDCLYCKGYKCYLL